MEKKTLLKQSNTMCTSPSSSRSTTERHILREAEHDYASDTMRLVENEGDTQQFSVLKHARPKNLNALETVRSYLQYVHTIR